jgi:hypothetical protein
VHHKNTEQCHYTYFNQLRKFVRRTLRGSIPSFSKECRTVYESSCTTKYVEKQPGKFVGDTGCTYEEGAEECHSKVIASIVDVLEEISDLNLQKTCRFVTKQKSEHLCTIVPQEICNLKFSQPKQVN